MSYDKNELISIPNIPFNKPYVAGNEINYINKVLGSNNLSGNGKFTKLCQAFFEKKYGFKKCLLTTSCTDALEMAALLLEIKEGDEVIMPNYTFVSTANAFLLRNAKVVFADSNNLNPNIDADKLEQLINKHTKAIVVVHYAGMACEMGKIMDIAKKYNLFVVEDAAQAIDNYYIDNSGNRIPLGSIGHLAAFSFHESKNIISGEGGMLVINDDRFLERSEIIWEKGTNRAAFYRGVVDKYGWKDLGSSFLMSEITAAFLYGQILNLDIIQKKRVALWHEYFEALKPFAALETFQLPQVPDWSTNNAHIFYLVTKTGELRNHLISVLKDQHIQSAFHYLSLNKSDFYLQTHPRIDLPNSDRYTECLLRLPLFYELEPQQARYIAGRIISNSVV